MTIRLKLTLLFVLLLASIGVFRVGFVLWGFSETLDQLAQTEATNKVQQMQSYLLELDEDMREDGQRVRLRSQAALPRAFSDDGMYLQLTGLDGMVYNKSPNLDTHTLPTPPGEGVTVVEMRQPDHPEPFQAVLVSRRIELPGRGLTVWAQAAHSLEDKQRTLTSLAIVEVGAWAGALLVAFVVGFFFAGRALAPVADMTRQVRDMRSTDLHRRLAVRQPAQDEIDQLGATFNELFDRVETAFEAQRRFVADASHELKSPLTTVRGTLQLLKRRSAQTEEARAWTETALREVDRLTRLVNELLELARVGEGRQAMVKQRVDLARVAREVAAQFEAVAPRVRFREAVGQTVVMGDPDRLKQVLINLVDNAVRATREGGEVTLDVAQEGDRACLTVTDSGCGMAPEVLARIFDRFYRVDDARDRGHGGTGLGLSITRAIVAAHDGTIDAQSRLSEGTSFYVRIPLARPESA
ncbi:MAG: sensor histidine kinase [Candidatus Sericytochromatia bacterium]